MRYRGRQVIIEGSDVQTDGVDLMRVGWHRRRLPCSAHVDGSHEWCNWGDSLLASYYVDSSYVVPSTRGNEFDFRFACYYLESCVGRWL